MAVAVAHAVADGTDVGFIASATPRPPSTLRAPLTFRPEAERVEKRVPRRARARRCCGRAISPESSNAWWLVQRGPLAAFGILFGGSPVRIHAHEHPFGVGYLVATSERDA